MRIVPFRNEREELGSVLAIVAQAQTSSRASEYGVPPSAARMGAHRRASSRLDLGEVDSQNLVHAQILAADEKTSRSACREPGVPSFFAPLSSSQLM